MSTRDLIKEEQEILDDVIKNLDQEMKRLKNMSEQALAERKKIDKSLADTYLDLVLNNDEQIRVNMKKREMMNIRDELYDSRIVVDIIDDGASEDDPKEEREFKIGLHSYGYKDKIYIMSWKNNICRHFLMDNASEKYVNETKDHKQTVRTEYQLKLKRKIDIYFDKVKDASQLFPTLEELEEIVSDEFLKELLKRRSSKEFQNIVFSIQKHQGEIIQSPFKQNMIVQGCAGSGKSMIMLHRLPILMYDNPNVFGKNNIYIITPSLAYIEQAERLCVQLEIEDLNMGTIKQYYDWVLRKYGKNPSEYGKMDSSIVLLQEQSKYVYSKECIEDISREITSRIDAKGRYTEEGAEFFSLNAEAARAKSLQELLNKKIIRTQKVIDAADNVLQSYHRIFRSSLVDLDELRRTVTNRKVAIINSLTRKKTSNEETIEQLQKELLKLNEEENKIAIENRNNRIQILQSQIKEYNAQIEKIENDANYEKALLVVREMVSKIQKDFDKFNLEFAQVDYEIMYTYIANKNAYVHKCRDLAHMCDELTDEYDILDGNIAVVANKLVDSVMKLEGIKFGPLRKSCYEGVIAENEYFKELADKMVQQVYQFIMEKIDQKPNDKGVIKAVECSPYLYTQILYQYQGAPNAGKEALICIDEAQNFEVQEFALMKAINGNQLIFNLYGDEKQHVEGSKGIDSWKEVKDIIDYKQYDMMDNYRNARQITEYCNEKFFETGKKMRAINLAGTGVQEYDDENEFVMNMLEYFAGSHSSALRAIIVKDSREARYVLDVFSAKRSKMYDMTNSQDRLDRGKWNIITVGQSKGLEFQKVITFVGRMTENEKYIACTRALDELIVYTKPVEGKDAVVESKKDVVENKIETKEKKRHSRHKDVNETIDFSNSEVRKFFEEKGLEVIDQRAKKGALWIVGEKEQLQSIVDEAVEKWGISGVFSAGKATKFRNGWYTKTKK